MNSGLTAAQYLHPKDLAAIRPTCYYPEAKFTLPVFLQPTIPSAATRFSMHVSPKITAKACGRPHPAFRHAGFALGLLLFGLCLVAFSGCSRIDYRLAADRDSYGLLASRELDPLWSIPRP